MDRLSKKDLLNIILAIFCLLIVSATWIVLIAEADPQEEDPFIIYTAPDNSFGMGTFREINPIYLKNLLKNNINWDLFYKRYVSSSWTSGNDYLDINLSWNSSRLFYKITLTFNVPVDIYQAEFRMNFNKNILDYVEKNDNEVCFNYSTDQGNINLMFNFSDLKNINGLYFNKYIENNKFYFIFGKFDIPAGFYVFDPIMGDNTGSNTYNFNTHVALGINGSPEYDALAYNITAKFSSVGSSNIDVKGALFDDTFGSPLTPIAMTETKNVACSGSPIEYTFNFTTPVEIYSANTYYIVMLSNLETGTMYIYWGTTGGSGYYFYDTSITFLTGSCPSPIKGSEPPNDIAYIYCCYEAELPTTELFLSNYTDCPFFNFEYYLQNSTSSTFNFYQYYSGSQHLQFTQSVNNNETFLFNWNNYSSIINNETLKFNATLVGQGNTAYLNTSFNVNLSNCSSLGGIDDMVEISFSNEIIIFMLWVFLGYLAIRSKESIEILPLSLAFLLIGLTMATDYEIFRAIFIVTATICVFCAPLIRIFKKVG